MQINNIRNITIPDFVGSKKKGFKAIEIRHREVGKERRPIFTSVLQNNLFCNCNGSSPNILMKFKDGQGASNV